MSDSEKIWDQLHGDGPIVALAVHDGHALRPEVAAVMALDELGRLREEDPFTGAWSELSPTRLVGRRSRFEVDLNRPRDRAVYRKPEDAWGLRVWQSEISDEIVERSLRQYDAFFAALRSVLDEKQERHGHFVVYDLHTYNHLRDGPDGPAAAPAENPQVNIGTGTMDRHRWTPVVDRFIRDLSSFPFSGGSLDVRENVKFKGGEVSRWVHENYPESGCAIAVEFKKFFMNEWTGEPDRALLDAIDAALRSTVPGVLEELATK